MAGEFETVAVAHDDCDACDRAVIDAEIMAKVTGSTGATYHRNELRPGDEPDVDHSATVKRIPVPLRSY